LGSSFSCCDDESFQILDDISGAMPREEIYGTPKHDENELFDYSPVGIGMAVF
jgi:hypothetical protein